MKGRSKKKADQVNQALSVYLVYAMLVALCFVWYLCYVGELRMAGVRDQELLGRLEDPNITEQLMRARVDSMYGKPTSLPPNTNPSKQSSIPRMCLVVTHKPTNQNFFGSLLSILTQIPTLPPQSLPLTVYYLNNKQGSKQFQKYLSENAIHSSVIRFESVEEEMAGDFWGVVQVAKRKCFREGIRQRIREGNREGNREGIVGIMGDDVALVGGSLGVVGERFGDGNVGYGGMAVINRQKSDISLGQSYPYPSQILQTSTFKSYPFVLTGPIFLSPQMLHKTTCKYCKNPHNKKPYVKANKPAVLLEMLELAEGKIVYVDDVLGVVGSDGEEKFVTDLGVRGQLREIYGVKGIGKEG